MSRPRLSDLIGALELGAGSIVVGDAALEASVTAGPPMPMSVPIRCIGDGALEAAAIAGPTPTPSAACTYPPHGNGCVGDGALEAFVSGGPVPTQRPWPCIGDDALEVAVSGGPMPTQRPFCIGDGVLEEAAGPSRNPTMPHPFGPCIGDAALEAAGGAAAGPTQLRCPPTMGCAPAHHAES